MNQNYLPFEEPLLEIEKKLEHLRSFSSEKSVNIAATIAQLEKRRDDLARQIFSRLTPWQRVQVARHPDRPVSSVYVSLMFKDFIEMYGDRRFADDKAVITGLGRLDGRKVMFIGHRKGRTTKDRIACNFGMPHPEGFRKALIKMKLAEKFKIPMVTFMDTTGAYPGIGAEERGIAESIAENLFVMSRLETPIICVVIGEGASGGALGIGVGDRMAVLEYAYYSVISPEGCAAILWKTGEKAPDAAAAMKITSGHLKSIDVIDDVVPEPLGGAHRSPAEAAANLERYVIRTLAQLRTVRIEALLERRYQRWRRMGKHVRLEAAQVAPAK